MRQAATFMRGVHAFAVGAGIARTIRAATDEPAGETIESWVQFCIAAAEEAYAATIENPPTLTIEWKMSRGMAMLLSIGDAMSREDNEKHGATVTNNAEEYERKHQETKRPMDGAELETTAHNAAAMAFKCCMPQLTGRRRAQAYFACVAAGLQRGYFKGVEAKAMLHSAQLALNAYPKRQQKPRPARRNEPTEP